MCSHCGAADPVIDVRFIAPRMLHATISTALELLASGESLIIIADADTKRILQHFQARSTGRFQWVDEQKGPDRWRASLSKLAR
jgi:uncharacterized protein (DUF2249 family)